MPKIKNLTVTNRDRLVLTDLRNDYIMLGFAVSPIDGDSFTVYSGRLKDKKVRRDKE